MSQENELSVWGLTKIFRRNLVIGVIMMLLVAISVLVNAVVSIKDELGAKNVELVHCKEEAADKINELRIEQINFVTRMLERQQQIEKDLRDTQVRIKSKR